MPNRHYLKNELDALIKNDDTIFNFIQNSSLDGLWYWDLEHPEHEWMNAKFWKTLGYDPADMPHRADAWQDIINQDDLQVAIDNFNKHCADPNHPYDQIVRYQHKDGSTVWIRCRGLAIRDENGTPVRMLGAHIDVTALKEAELRAREDAKLYKTILENQSAYLIKLDLEGNYTYVNDFYCDDFGWPRDTLLGQSSLDGIIPEDHQTSLDAGLVCFANPSKRHKARLRKQLDDGRIKVSDWEFTALTDEDGQPSGLICIGVDVTEQVEAESALKASEAQFRFIAENTSDGILVFRNGRTTYASPAYTRILGYSLEEEKARTEEDIYALLHPEDRERIRTLIGNAISQQKRHFSYEYRALHKDGYYVWREDRATLLYGDDGLPVESLLMARDITERKQAEADLLRTTTLLNDAQRITNMGGWELDVTTGTTVWTDQVYAIHEVPLDTPTNKVDGISFYHPDDQPVITAAITQSIEQQVSFDVQCRFITATGKHRWVRASGYPLVEQQQVTRLIGTFQDITEQKLLEERIRKSEQQLYSTLASMDDLVFVIDSKGVFREAYSTHKENFYVPETVFLNQTYDTVLPPELVTKTREVLAKAQNSTDTETFAFDYQLEQDGTPRWYSAKATTRFDQGGHYDGVTVVTRDITDRKQAEVALQESEKRYRLLADNSQDLIALHNLDGTFVYASPAYEWLLGYSQEELFTSPPTTLLHPDDGVLGIAAHRAVLLGRPLSGLQYRLKKKDGTYIWVEANTSLLTDEVSGEKRLLASSRDITNRKQAEVALRESKAQLDLFFNQSLTGFFFMMLDEPIMWDDAEDKEGLLEYTFDHLRITKTNRAFADQYATTPDALIGNTPREMFAHDLGRGRIVWQQLFDEGHLHIETEERRADGNTVFIEGDYICLYDEQSRITGHFGVQLDVTSRKRAEDALQHTTTLLSEAQRIAEMGAWELDVATNDVTWTNQVYAIHEVPSSTPINKVDGISFFHPDYQPMINAAINQAIEQQTPYDVQCRFITAKGNHRWVRAVGHPVTENGQVVRLIGMFQDISKQKYAEQALAESEAKFRSFVENANDVIFTLSPEGNLLYTSPQWEDLKGIKGDDVIGASFVPLIHPEDVPAAYDAILQVVTNKQAFNDFIYRSKYLEDAWHWFSANGAPITDDAGNVTAILVTSRDITSNKAAEHAMQATLKQLEQALAHNTLLMKELHHRVKNNLAVVSSLLALQAYELTDGVAKDALQESRKRILAMSEIHELMYRHDSASSIAFDDYLASLVNRMERSFSRGQRQIHFSLDTSSFELGFDQAIPLGLILNELLTNATKYAFPEDYPDPHVNITINVDDGLTLVVADNGVGLTSDKALETSDSLGMTVIKSLTDQLSGHVSFHNRPHSNIGLQVTLHIPLTAPNHAQTSASEVSFL
jgi:PAS domain S-box-containing protein